MISLKLHRREEQVLVAACDESLLDKEITDDKRGIKINLRKDFYYQQIVPKEVFIEFLKIATIGNFFGDETINAAIEANYIDKNCILYIGGIPHAQFVRV